MTITPSQLAVPSDYFLESVCGAYVLHKVSVHRRPVYRHQHGDIELNKYGLMGLLDGRLSDHHNPAKRARMYARCLNKDSIESGSYSPEKEGYLFSMGTNPALTQRAVRWIDRLLKEYGDMVHEYGGATAFDNAIMEMETAR